jgi:hypothetical protein
LSALLLSGLLFSTKFDQQLDNLSASGAYGKQSRE